MKHILRQVGAPTTTTGGEGLAAGSESTTATIPQVTAEKTNVTVTPTTKSETVNVDAGAELARPAQSTLTNYRNEENGLIGDIEQSDLQMPRLQIAQGSGEMTKLFNSGTLVYMNEVLLDAPNPAKKDQVQKIRVVPLSLRKQYRETLTEEEKKEDPDRLPRTVDTKDEVKELGGTTEWIAGEKPSWGSSAIILMLVEKPGNVEHGGFVIEIAGKQYGPAVYYAASTAYRTMAKPIISAAAFALRENGRPYLPKRFWSFEVSKIQAGAFTIYAPVVKMLSEDTSAELRDVAATFSGKVPTASE